MNVTLGEGSPTDEPELTQSGTHSCCLVPLQQQCYAGRVFTQSKHSGRKPAFAGTFSASVPQHCSWAMQRGVDMAPHISPLHHSHYTLDQKWKKSRYSAQTRWSAEHPLFSDLQSILCSLTCRQGGQCPGSEREAEGSNKAGN